MELSQELHKVNSSLENIQKKQEEHEHLLQNQSSEIKEIKLCIVGNETFGQEGLVSKVNTIHKDVEGFKKIKQRMTGYVFGASAVATVVFEYLKNKFQL